MLREMRHKQKARCQLFSHSEAEKKYNFLEEDSENLIKAREERGGKGGGKQDNSS